MKKGSKRPKVDKPDPPEPVPVARVDLLSQTTSTLNDHAFFFLKNTAKERRKELEPLIPSKYRKILREASAATDGFYPLKLQANEYEPPEFVAARRNALQMIQRKSADILRGTQESLNKEAFKKILDFIVKDERSVYELNEIPTALLFAGVNTADHAELFQCLEAYLRQPHELSDRGAVARVRLARISAARCASSIKETIKAVVEDIMESEVTEGSRYSIEELIQWKKESESGQTDEAEYGSEQTQASFQKLQLVLLVEDFEGFDHEVLADFIYICSRHQKKLSFVFLFCLSTSADAIQALLPRSVSSLLRLEKFQLQPSVTCLTELIDKLFRQNQSPLLLSSDILDRIIDAFMFSSLSIRTFAKSFEFICGEHFLRNPLSFLCDPECTLEPTDAHVEWAKENVQSLRQPGIKDKISKKELVRLVENLRRKARNFSVAFECFLQLEKLNTQPPTKKETRKWNHYVMMLGNKPERVDYIQNLLAQVSGQVDKLSKRAGEVRMIGLQALYDLLQQWQRTLRDSIAEVNDLAPTLKSITRLFETMGKMDLKKAEAAENVSGIAEIEKIDTSELSASKKRKEVVQAIRGVQKPDPIRKKLGNLIETFLAEHVKSPEGELAQEILYYDRWQAIESRFYPMVYRTVHVALTRPDRYLRCTCCLSSPSQSAVEIPPAAASTSIDSILGRTTQKKKSPKKKGKAEAEDKPQPQVRSRALSPSQTPLPRSPLSQQTQLQLQTHLVLTSKHEDICIVYQIMRDSGKLINVADWHLAFAEIVKPRMETADQIQTRFFNSVTELFTMGFIKPTNQRAEHVKRLDV